MEVWELCGEQNTHTHTNKTKNNLLFKFLCLILFTDSISKLHEVHPEML